MLEDPRKRTNPLPLPVTTGTGSYTAGTRITSRSAPRSAPGPSRVDFSSTPTLQKPFRPAPASTGYTQSNVNADRNARSAPGPSRVDFSSTPTLQKLFRPAPASTGYTQSNVNADRNARSRTPTPVASLPPPPNPPLRTTPGFANRHFQVQPPGPGGRTTPAVAPVTPLPAAPAVATRPAVTQQAVQSDLAQPGSLPLLPGQGYFRNNTTGQVTTLDSPPQKRRATAALPAQPGQPAVEPAGRRPGVLPRLNPNLTTGDALASFINQAATAGETIAGNRAVAGAEKRTRQGIKDEQEALKSDLDALTAVKGLRAPPTTDQVKAGRAQQLLAQNPADFTATDRLLFGDRTSTNRRKIIEEPVVGADGFSTGAKRFYSVDAETGESIPVSLPSAGGAQGQGGGVPADGTYDVPGRGRITVKGGRAFDESGKEVQ